MPARSVVITGTGAFTGNASCTAEFADRLRVGATAIRALTGSERWPISEGAVVDFDALAGRLCGSSRGAPDRDHQLAACVLEEALDSAGLASHPARQDSAVVVGSVQYPGRARMAERLADEYRLGRPRIVTDAACSAGAHALGIAAQLVRSGVAPIAVAIGYNLLQGKDVLGLYKLGILTRERIRPFDRLRTGTQPGEGAAALVVEDAAHAMLRGAVIQAELAGFGGSADAHQIVAPDLAGIGVSIAVRAALAQAGIGHEQIDYLNAHGTGTKLNDPSETAGLRRALGESAYRVPISSTKPITGHTLGAAGIIEAVATLLATRYDFIPPTLNYENFDPACDLDYVTEGARWQRVDHAASTSSGFGGIYSCVVFRKFRGTAAGSVGGAG